MTLNLENVDERTAREPAPRRPRKPFWRRPWILPLAVVVVLYVYLQSAQVVGVPADQRPLPPHDDFPAYYPLLVVHMIGGTVAMFTMCLQLWPWLRQHHPRVHRVSGRLYVSGTIVSAVLGLIVVWWAPQPGKLGGVCMLLFWLVATVAAFRAIRRRNFVAHRRYMLYSFAVAANNLWAFFILMAIKALEIPLDMAYFAEGARWITWVGNLMLVQWWLYRTARRPKSRASIVDGRS